MNILELKNFIEMMDSAGYDLETCNVGLCAYEEKDGKLELTRFDAISYHANHDTGELVIKGE